MAKMKINEQVVAMTLYIDDNRYFLVIHFVVIVAVIFILVHLVVLILRVLMIVELRPTGFILTITITITITSCLVLVLRVSVHSLHHDVPALWIDPVVVVDVVLEGTA